MKQEHQQYILENISRKSAEAIAKDLGLKERKVKRFLERQKNKDAQPSVTRATPVKKKNIALSIIFIIILGFAVYGNSIHGEFIWDDTNLVEDNLYIRNWSNLPKFFTEGMGAGADAATVYSFYRPLQLITYAVDYSFWKLDKILNEKLLETMQKTEKLFLDFPYQLKPSLYLIRWIRNRISLSLYHV